jgi:LL-diaminopimelate aminotransferase
MNRFEEKIIPADRVAWLKPYFFADLNNKIELLRSQGLDIIRLDIGSPDLPPQPFIIEQLIESAHRTSSHGYATHGGTLAFRKAAADYYERRFNVDLNPQEEVLGLIGSKEGIFNLSQAVLNPGDIVLVPDPGYPVYSAGGRISGAQILVLPLLAEKSYLPDLEAVPEEIARRCKILWLNYPNNPTGAVAPLEFFEKAVAFATKYGILLAHDAAYVDVCFDGYQAPSIMQISGAREVAIEFNSLSKTYNMAGWRVGMAVGNASVINLLSQYKSQIDSAHFLPIYQAAEAALGGSQSWLEERNQVYQERRDWVISALVECGCELTPPRASLYIWAQLPGKQTDCNLFCSRLLEETGVSLTPGTVFGEFGKGYIRISLCTSIEKIETAMLRLKHWIR